MIIIMGDEQRVTTNRFGGEPEEWMDYRATIRALLGTKGLRKAMESAEIRAPVVEKKEGSKLLISPIKGTSNTKDEEETGGGAETKVDDPGGDKTNAKIYWWLLMTTKGGAKDIVMQYDDTSDGRAAWQALCGKYELDGSVQSAVLQGKLINDKLGDGEDPDAYFIRIEKARRQLKSLGMEITDAMLLGYALNAMPASYRELRVLIDNTSGLTYEDFKRRMRNHYRREIVSGVTQDSALTAGEFKGKCHRCGVIGHMKVNCPKKGKAKGNGGAKKGKADRFKGKCNFCGKEGHKEADCWAKKRDEGGAANAAPEEVEVSLAAMEKAFATLTDSWIVDSGCTSHLVSSAAMLRDVRNVTGDIIVANGESMAFTAMGKLEARTTGASGGQVKVILNVCWWCLPLVIAFCQSSGLPRMEDLCGLGLVAVPLISVKPAFLSVKMGNCTRWICILLKWVVSRRRLILLLWGAFGIGGWATVILRSRGS